MARVAGKKHRPWRWTKLGVRVYLEYEFIAAIYDGQVARWARDKHNKRENLWIKTVENGHEQGNMDEDQSAS